MRKEVSNVKKTVKTSVLGVIAKAARKGAAVGANSASVWGFHQPKEPEAARKLRKS